MGLVTVSQNTTDDTEILPTLATRSHEEINGSGSSPTGSHRKINRSSSWWWFGFFLFFSFLTKFPAATVTQEKQKIKTKSRYNTCHDQWDVMEASSCADRIRNWVVFLQSDLDLIFFAWQFLIGSSNMEIFASGGSKSIRSFEQRESINEAGGSEGDRCQLPKESTQLSRSIFTCEDEGDRPNID